MKVLDSLKRECFFFIITPLLCTKEMQYMVQLLRLHHLLHIFCWCYLKSSFSLQCGRDTEYVITNYFFLSLDPIVHEIYGCLQILVQLQGLYECKNKCSCRDRGLPFYLPIWSPISKHDLMVLPKINKSSK